MGFSFAGNEWKIRAGLKVESLHPMGRAASRSKGTGLQAVRGNVIEMTGRVLEILNLYLRRSVEEPFNLEDREEFVETLVAQGHHPEEVYAALHIVDNIQQRMDAPILSSPRTSSNRLFLLLEEFHLEPDARGYLDDLVRAEVLSPVQRQEIVERTYMMDPEDLCIEAVEDLVDEVLDEEPRDVGFFDETISDFYH